LMDRDLFEGVEDVLRKYGATMDIYGGELSTDVYDLVDRLTKFAASIGDDNFVYDEEDILHVLERTDDEDLKRMYNIEFTSDVYVRVIK